MSTGPRPTACISCKKQKVRCRMDGGKPPCLRCRQRQTTCTMPQCDLPRGDEINLANALMHDLSVLHSAVEQLRSAEGLPSLPQLRIASLTTWGSNHGGLDSPPQSSSGLGEDPMADQDPRGPFSEVDLDQNPIGSLYEITRLRSLRTQEISPPSTEATNPEIAHRDLISNGLLDHGDAGRLVQTYLSRSDHYLYDVAGKFHDLEGIRAASPLLLAAICAVGALQDPSADRIYQVCRSELRKLIPEFIFKPGLDLEDLRGLVISAFWLSDTAWSVCGLAIRRALEVNLQNSFKHIRQLATAPEPNLEAVVERMKLWYLLYICDQHLSILYARPPMLGHQDSVRESQSFLDALPDSTCNQRLMSQVSLLRSLRSVSDLFGLDSSEAVPPVFRPQLDSFNQQVDAWAGKWLSSYTCHPVVGDYPSKAVSMHYYFAKLVVCAHVFRGFSHGALAAPFPEEFAETAKSAVQSAISIVKLTINDKDVVAALTGLPHYFLSMIAYACAFLFKATTRYSTHVEIDVEEIRSMIAQVIQLCNTSECGRQHLVKWIGKGLHDLMQEYTASAQWHGDDSVCPRSAEGTTQSRHGLAMGPGTEQEGYFGMPNSSNNLQDTCTRQGDFALLSPELQRLCALPSEFWNQDGSQFNTMDLGLDGLDDHMLHQMS